MIHHLDGYMNRGRGDRQHRGAGDERVEGSSLMHELIHKRENK